MLKNTKGIDQPRLICHVLQIPSTGGLIGGLTFPTRTFALVDGHPALFPSLVAAACALLIGCLVLRRLNRELTALGVS